MYRIIFYETDVKNVFYHKNSRNKYLVTYTLSEKFCKPYEYLYAFNLQFGKISKPLIPPNRFSAFNIENEDFSDRLDSSPPIRKANQIINSL